jgi:hypothetical protein
MPEYQARIPVEIWRIIFRYCTAHESLLDTSSLPALSDEPRAWTVDLSQVSMDTKLSLALASKAWHDVALPFLYEYIPIYHVARLPAIAILLKNIKDGGSSDSGDRIHTASSESMSFSLLKSPKSLEQIPNMLQSERDGLRNL